MKINKAILGVVVSASLLSVGMGARADILPNSTTITTVAGVTTYTYDMGLRVPETVVTGDYFTIYDFFGFTGLADVTDPAGWSATSSAFGKTPPLELPMDTIAPNVTFTYTGATITSPADLGNFSLKSTSLASSTAATMYAGSLGNGNDQFLHRLTGPVAPTPEPATLVPFALGGLGLLGLIVRKTRRANGAAA